MVTFRKASVINFIHSLYTTFVIARGRQLLGSFQSPFCLYNWRMFVCANCGGGFPVSRTLFIASHTMFSSVSCNSRYQYGRIPSGPPDFLGPNFCNMVRTESGVVIGTCCRTGWGGKSSSGSEATALPVCMSLVNVSGGSRRGVYVGMRYGDTAVL